MTKPVGFIQVALIASQEEGGYASICPELGIASQGETADEALANLRDATTVFLNTIEQLGQRDRQVDGYCALADPVWSSDDYAWARGRKWLQRHTD